MFLEGPVNSLNTNRDATSCVVAGRNVLKVFEIRDEGIFIERHNLRVGKHPNLNFGALDVAWSPLEEHHLATAATNGTVVVWNLAKQQKNKIEHTYTVHSQAVNKVCFHYSEPNYLLSGSQDASVNLFDLRKQTSVSTFSSGQDRIRDVKFSPHQAHHFACADEAGNVKIWDLRHSDKPYKHFSAHVDPVLSLDFHPVSRAWIATGSRDKLIKVWDCAKEKPTCEYLVQTITPVSLVSWRPQREWHIASCALVQDFSIHVWDVRRPFLPFASFEDHKDVATGLAWRQDPRQFISCGKDGLLKQHWFSEAARPADFANPISVDVSQTGDIGFSVGSRMPSQANSQTSFRLLPPFGGASSSQSSRSDLFRAPVPSHLTTFRLINTNAPFSMKWFVESAKRYKLQGLPFGQLCEQNASVARDLYRPQVAESWLMIKVLMESPKKTQIQKPVRSNNSSADVEEAADGETGGMSFGAEVEEQDDTESFIDAIKVQPTARLASTDFFFGGAAELLSSSLTGMPSFPANDWKLPREALEPKQDLDSSAHLLSNGFGHSPSSLTAGSSSLETLDPAAMEQRLVLRNPSPLTVSQEAIKFPRWNGVPLLVQILHHFVRLGDVQSTVSMLVVLGEKGRDLVEDAVQEAWYMAYLDLLDRAELWQVSALVIKLTPLASVNTLSQVGTSLAIGCPSCDKPTGRLGWRCERCRQLVPGCSVCKMPVRGLWVWCRFCEHGGHLEHMRLWFSRNHLCPRGCGHKCQMRDYAPLLSSPSDY